MKRVLSLHNPRTSWQAACLTAALLFSLLMPKSAQPVQSAAGDGDPNSTSTQSAPVTVLLVMKDQAALPNIASPALSARSPHSHQPDPGAKGKRVKAVVEALHAAAQTSQPSLLAQLETMRGQGKVSQVHPLWIVNAVAVTAQPAALAELARLPGVDRVAPNPTLKMNEPAPSAAAQTSLIGLSPALAQIHATDVWASGFRGQGVVVANIDSGVSLDNADLAAKWRGGKNSWFDVHNEHTTPVDSAADGTGHGTATMSVMVGAQTGVAPDAKWIAVKMFSDTGGAELSDALVGFQWVMDPDGNPATNDAADVVNNSWSQDVTGCTQDATLHTALQTLAAADILPVFAAGNFGPSVSTDPIPANYAEAFAVGAVTDLNDIAYFSSRGPSTCRPTELVFPDISAPGMDVPVARTDGTFTIMSGTSFSAPQAAGTLALLLSAFPNLSAEQQRLALLHGVNDLGPVGPDNTYGYGLLNALNAYLWLGGSEPNHLYFPTFLSDGTDHQGY